MGGKSGGRRRHRAQPGIVAVLATGLTILAALAAPAAGPAGGAPTRPAALHPVHQVGSWIVDGEGRVVITHGLNLIWKTAPYYPPSFSAKDARFLVSQGFTGARIGFLWAGVEPAPGTIDSGYVKEIARINRILGDFGIRTLVDFHQDDYSATYDGDGAPAWASVGSGALQAFQSLWDDQRVDGKGLVQHFDAAWTAGAKAVGRSPNLLGLDLFNEPYDGSATGCPVFSPCPQFEEGPLASFYRQLIASVRKVAPSPILFYEPVPQLTGDATALPAPLTGGTNLGFTFHYYDRACGLAPEPATAAAQQAQDLRCSPAEAAALDAGVAYARRAGVAIDFGEFGDSSNDTDDANMVDLADRRFLNWTYWEYYTTGSSLAPGLLLDDDRPGSEANVNTDVLDALVVPYPELVAGTPRTSTFDRSAGVMRFTYRTAPVDPHRSCPGAPTQIFVPERDFPHGYRVKATGARVVSSPTSAWVELVARPDAARVTVTISRATGSSTAVPTTAMDPHAPPLHCSADGG
ncbi:MAG TPA: cellulase family glycosylhydrolase [Acidimicrobiales bacterium]|nr:cellulase family glycosylhydrolase [Acidimicrobiales bacterium]